MIPKAQKEEVHRYITGVVQNRKHKLLAVHCMPDHTHMCVGLHPAQSISDLAQEVKTAATKFIKKQPWMPYDFAWQRGFGAFSYSRSHLDAVIRYVNQQEQHHQKRSFREEYLDFLKKFEVEYDEQYLFEFYD